jgi:hypothetical protein
LFSLLLQVVKVIPSTFTASFLKNIIKLWNKRNDFFLSFDFHSVGVYRMGDYMIKIKLKPQSVDRHFGRKMKVKDALEGYLETHDFKADVLVQICYVEWKKSPYIKIGEVRIDRNDLLDPKACENEMLSFNPFESKTFFQPVGKIQKLRNEAYKVSMQTRFKINKLLKYQ